MNRVGNFIRRCGPPGHAAIIAALAYLSGVTINLVTSKPDGSASFWFLALGGLVVCTMTGIAAALLDQASRNDRRREQREAGTHRSGYHTLNREISEYISLIRQFDPSGPRFLQASPVQLMKSACRDLYDTLEGEYGTGVSVSDHIEFEVTFMTLSLVDGALTIPAWANRDGRAPKSLTKRQGDPTVYQGTETEKLYQDPNRSVRFITDTAGQSYKELYPGQKARIRSSIIYPVVDDMFSLVGTLVVHCDSAGFFRSDAEKFWRELLEPYTKRLALSRVLADKISSFGFGVPF